MKKILVLGGNGFIGKNLIRNLANENFKIASMDLVIPEERVNNVDYIVGDFKQDDFLENLLAFDTIIHLISITNPRKSMEDPITAYSIDLLQTIKILEKIKNQDTRLIFASSGGTVYGDINQEKFNEADEIGPINYYGLIKYSIENAIIMHNKLYSKKNIILRIANPYGPGQDYKKGVGVLDLIIKKMLSHQEIEIWGDGTQIRDYIYIDDLIDAFEKTIYYEGEESIFNIGSGQGLNINNLIDIVGNILSYNEKLFDSKIRYIDSKNIGSKRIVLDILRAKKELKFEPKIKIEEGIRRYIDYLYCNIKK